MFAIIYYEIWVDGVVKTNGNLDIFIGGMKRVEDVDELTRSVSKAALDASSYPGGRVIIKTVMKVG